MFVKIKAVNFFSWAELEFDFTTGVTLIAGKNLDDGTSEGSGKSSVANALCWGLYGQLPKDVNIDDVIKTGEKHCKVEIHLNNGQVIVRSRKPNDLYIQGDKVNKGKDAKETQKLICELIGMSFDTFCQSVYFAQNYNNKFITANQEEKGKILSELQDLSVFDKASKRSADLLKEFKFVDLQQLQASKQHKSQILAMVQSELKTFTELSANFDSDKANKLNELVLKSEDLKNRLTQVEADLQTIDLSGADDTHASITKLRDELSTVDQQLHSIATLRSHRDYALQNKTCRACGQDLPHNHNVGIEVPDDSELLAKKADLKAQIVSLEKQAQVLTEAKHKNILLTERLKNLKQEELNLLNSLNKLESQVNPYGAKIAELTAKGFATDQELKKILKQIADKEVQIRQAEFLKSGFKEIKSFVFQGLLAELNSKANKYLRELFEVPAMIKFDNVSEDGEISKIQTVVILDGYERSLGLLSGGQFRRVQLAVDFALSEIVAQRSKNPISVRILDEVFKDLSEASMDKVVRILQGMQGSTVLIEHNSMVRGIVNNVFQVEYKNGTSTRQND